MKKIEIDHLDTKIRKIENQLKPILSTPRNPQTKPSDKLVVEEFHDCLHVISDRLSAEMASPSDETPPLKDIVKRVVLLQKAAHAWTEGSSSLASFEESCVTDDGAGLAGFKVYENPVFDGVLESDNDGGGDDSTVDGCEVEEFERNEEESVIGVADQDEVQESEAGNDSVEKEVLEVDCQNEEDINVEEKEEDEEEQENDDYEDKNQEEGAASQCCYKTMFWGLIIVMVSMSISMDFLNFSNHQSSVILLAPT